MPWLLIVMAMMTYMSHFCGGGQVFRCRWSIGVPRQKGVALNLVRLHVLEYRRLISLPVCFRVAQAAIGGVLL